MSFSPELTTTIVGITALLVGALLAFVMQQSRIAAAREAHDTTRARLHQEELAAQEARQALDSTRDNLLAERQKTEDLTASLEAVREASQALRLQQATDAEALSGAKRELETQQVSARQQQASIQSQLDDVRDAMKQEQSAKEALGEEVSRLTATLSDRESRLESREKTLQETQQRLEAIEAELRQQRQSSQERLETNHQELAKAREALGSAQTDLKSREKTLQDTQERLEATETELRQHRQNAQQRIDDAQKALAQTREALGSAQSDLKSTTDNLQEARTQRDEVQKRLHEVQEAHHALKKAHGELMTRTEEKEAQFARQLQWMEESKQQLKVEFENLANELLDQKGKAFSSLSERNIQELLKPFQSEIKGFREKVETLHTQETEQRASLRTELKHLQQLNRDITDQAAQLTQALKGQKKVQGNWGELMLENVLDSSGLRPGEDYQRERSFDTEDGKRRPDALVYLPQGRHLVIDAKTSLAAYLEYVNAEDDLTRQRALADHAHAVNARIEELADKHYYDLPGLNSPEVVVMFIPVESAYIEALRHDPTLYQRAIERNVLVATPTTLLTSLNIVSQLWRFENQSRHSAELARKAERFYNKLATFLESMQDVGKKLDGARGSYDKALGQLVNGKGNLVKQATEFRELGVAVKKELPTEIVERAQLEVGINTEDKKQQSHTEKKTLPSQ